MGRSIPQPRRVWISPRPIDAPGVPGPDLVLGGGLRCGARLLIGPPGGDKTTLAAQLTFADVAAGRRAVLLTTYRLP